MCEDHLDWVDGGPSCGLEDCVERRREGWYYRWCIAYVDKYVFHYEDFKNPRLAIEDRRPITMDA